MPENADHAASPRPVEVLLSLGSNIDPERYLRAAVDELRARFGEVELSPAYRTAAVGFDGAPFVNAAAALRTELPLQALEDWLHALEDRHGRDRSGPRLPNRTLDVDVVFYGDLVVRDGPRIRVPRPELPATGLDVLARRAAHLREHAAAVQIARHLGGPVPGRPAKLRAVDGVVRNEVHDGVVVREQLG